MNFLSTLRSRSNVGKLNLYLLRQLVVAFVFASLTVIFVVLFTQSFRLLSLVIDNSSTMLFFFQLMVLSVPTFLPLVLPLALGGAVLFVYQKLAVDSELVVMRAAGISPMRQAMPAFLMAVVVTIACYLLTLWITPAAHRNLVAMQYHMKDNYAVLLSRPGNFNDVTDGLTFYTRARGSNGELEGILMHDIRKPEMPVTIMAERGQVMEKDGEPQLVIFNGKRQEMNVETGQLSQLTFEQYVLDVNSMLTSSAESRLPDPREQTLTQLLNPTQQMLEQRASHERLMAELNQRIATPLLALSYTLIGLAAVLAGEFNRRGIGKRILAAAAAIIAVQVMNMSLVSIVARNGWFVFALYVVALAPAAIGVALLNSERLRKTAQRYVPAAMSS